MHLGTLFVIVNGNGVIGSILGTTPGGLGSNPDFQQYGEEIYFF